jgi:hypothetical protein
MDLKEIMWRMLTEFICLGWGPVAGCFEHGNEPSGSTKGGFLDWLCDYQLLQMDSPQWSFVGWLVSAVVAGIPASYSRNTGFKSQLESWL